MIIRKYETKEECVGLFVNENFDCLDSTLITEGDEWFERWSFVDLYDGDIDEDREDISWYDEERDLKYLDGVPMWNYWFVPNDATYYWLERNLEKAAECGFVLVMHDGEFYALAVDGCGYSFRDTHFTKLYDAMDLRWHE